MAGETLVLDNVLLDNTVLEIKGRVCQVWRHMREHRQRIMFRAGPHGMTPLADEMTLGDAGVTRDGSAVLDVLVLVPTVEEVIQLSDEVLHHLMCLRVVVCSVMVCFHRLVTFKHTRCV